MHCFQKTFVGNFRALASLVGILGLARGASTSASDDAGTLG
jgi:hypothetical protein